ncbi:MAG: EVE domain-containing protein [Xanthomonadales bacterium]|nr:EVE domain-containing protein [Xanthomonadales bacterium]MCB1613741.1 EVE domain-containing protein [Xanthomonadales bacterium]MCP5476002.1 EVE domain-containing protein [Rhodanobacteraceae bacterium]
MSYWLMKSEPDVFSIDDLKRKKREAWDGVRNYQARNYLRSMAVGDEVLFYHSSCAVPGAVGIARIRKAAFPDPTQFDPASDYFDAGSKPEDPRWSAVEVEFQRKFKQPLPLEMLKTLPELADLALVKRGNRLSVMPVSENEWRAITALAK